MDTSKRDLPWGGLTITIKPLPFKQLRETLPTLIGLGKKLKERGFEDPDVFDQSMDLIAKSCPSHSREELENAPARLQEWDAVLGTIGEFAGLDMNPSGDAKAASAGETEVPKT